MIDIIRFAEMLHDIRGKVNEGLPQEEQIASVIVSPKEEHLTKKLKDSAGIVLCSNYPDCDTTVQNADNWTNENHCLVFLLEKVNAGSQTHGEELQHYAMLQGIMERLKGILMGENFSCDYSFDAPKQIRTEWEYNYSGFNGLSIGFDLRDND